MRAVFFEEASEFAATALPYLAAFEAHHSLLLDIVERARRGAFDNPPLMAAVLDDEAPVAIAVRTPPFRLVLSLAPIEAAELLAREMAERELPLPGVLGPSDASTAFARAWAEATSTRTRPGHRLRAHAADHVEPVRQATGTFRAARATETPTLVAFWEAFAVDAGTSVPAAERAVAEAVREGRLFVWEDGAEIVSMAQASGPTPSGVRVNLVYTPSDRRGRGYATSCVAALTRRLLEGGRRFCFLFTDVANPTSNRIYAAIGYRPVCDFQEYEFDGARRERPVDEP